MDASTQYVQVPVPAPLVGPGLRAGRPAHDRRRHGRPRRGAQRDREAKVSLTPELVDRIFDESHDAHRRLLKYLADNRETWLYSDQVALGLALPGGSKSLAGMLGALGRRANHRYGGLKPFYSEWDPVKGQAKHYMPAMAADVINQL